MPQTLTRAQRIKKLRKRDGDTCFYCPKILTDDEVTFDHFVPRAAGGTWDLSNLRLSCRPCNNKKGDRVPLADGTIPGPPPRQLRRAVKRINRPETCPICYTGRLVRQGESCFACGRGALPINRSFEFKRRVWECDHSQTWCPSCVLLLPEEKHDLLAAKYATLGIMPESEAIAG